MEHNETDTPSVTRNSRHIVNPSMSRYPGINRKSLIVCKMWLWVRRETIKRGFNRHRLCSFNVPAAAEAHIHQILFKFSHTMTGNRLIQAYGVSIWNQIIEYNALCLHPSLSLTHTHTGTHSLLSPPKFYSRSSSWTGFLKIFFFLRDLVPIRKCVRQNNWIFFLFASEGRERGRKSQRAVICFSIRKGRIIWGSLGCVTHLLFECKKEEKWRRKRDIFNLFLDWNCVQSNLQQQLEGSHVFNVSSHLIQTTPHWQWFTWPHYMLYGYMSTSFTLSHSYHCLSTWQSIGCCGCYFHDASVSTCACSGHFDFS